MDRNPDRNKEIRKRIGAMLLSLVVAVTMIPVFAFADEIPERGIQAGAADGQAQTEEIMPESESVRITGAADDEEKLIGQFVEKETAEQIALREGEQVRIKTVRGDRLRGNTRIYYDKLVIGIGDIADGNSSTAAVTVDLKEVMGGSLSYTAEELGVSSLRVEGEFSPVAGQAFEEKFRCDIKSLYSALLYDLPYRFYWHDKTASSGAMVFNVVSAETGKPVSYYTNGKSVYFRESDKPVVQFLFCVSKDYNPDGRTGTNDIDADKTARARAAAQNAADLITANRGVASDYQKLVNYREYICGNNVYNSAAAKSIDAADYGDPWQMISVFDGDPDTNVVCEGYSKAFQFLCDHTDFASSLIECYSVSGRLEKNTSHAGTVSGEEANHMWNIIRMNDGRYYMADITNCDSAASFAPDLLFLKGSSAAGTPSSGYRFSGRNGNYLYYCYDVNTMSMFSYELELSASDYGTEEQADENRIAADIRRQSDERSAADDARETEAYNARRAAAAAAENAIVEAARKAAEEAARKAAEEAAKKKHVHKYHVTKYFDYVKYRCIGCGRTYSVSRIVRDLPKVRIRKPAGAKAAVTVKWYKVSRKNRDKISGIEIQYGTKKNFESSYKVTAASKTAADKTIRKLAGKKLYYVRIRSYRWIKGKKHVSAWSSVESVRTR